MCPLVETRKANPSLENVRVVCDTAFEPFIFEKDQYLYILWWKHSHIEIKLKRITTTSVSARIVVENVTKEALTEVLNPVPELNFMTREAEVGVSFADSLVLVEIRDILNTTQFYGVRMRRDIQGGEVNFDQDYCFC